MNGLKHPSFFRPASRPTSPAPLQPASQLDGDRYTHPLNKLSLSNFRRSTASSTTATPSVITSTPTAPLIQDGSYLETLALKLSEAVSKALSQPTGPANASEQVLGKRPIPQGRGQALGSLIATELKSTQDNLHLYRAIIRSLHRPLSVLLTNLSAHLMPLLSTPAFNSAPTIQAPGLNASQLHAIALAGFSEELLVVFDEFDLGTENDVRGEGLKSIREGLVSVINRVVNPLVGAIRNDLIPLMEALEKPNTNTAKPTAGTKGTTVLHPSIVTLQTLMPLYERVLRRCTTCTVTHTTLATLLISVLWKGFVALSHRPDIAASPPSSPDISPVMSVLRRRGSPTSTPSITPPPGRFTIKLPASRPPSPPSAVVLASAAGDCRALYEVLSLLPRPSADKPSTKLAGEAVSEAFEGLKHLGGLLEALQNKSKLPPAPNDLTTLTAELPTLIALPVILRAFLPKLQGVPEILGLSDEEYRKGCLSGFSRAEECAGVVAQRVLYVLRKDPGANETLTKWLEVEIMEVGED